MNGNTYDDDVVASCFQRVDGRLMFNAREVDIVDTENDVVKPADDGRNERCEAGARAEPALLQAPVPIGESTFGDARDDDRGRIVDARRIDTAGDGETQANARRLIESRFDMPRESEERALNVFTRCRSISISLQ